MSRWLKAAAVSVTMLLTSFALSSAQAEDNDGLYPMPGMMGGGCPVMGFGGPMMGPVMIGQVPGMMPLGMPYGMMSWNGGYGSSGIYQSMMGGRMMGNGAFPKNMQTMMGNAAAVRPHIAALVEGRLAYLRAELGITAAETDVWNAYADAVRNHVGLMQDVHQRMFQTMVEGNAVDRMKARIDGMEGMLNAMKAIQPAIEHLYTMLSDDQKHLADQLIGLDCGGV